MPRAILFFEDWNKHKLEFDDIAVLPEHEPANPEEDEDVVPDQHAAFGITKSQQNKRRQAAWKDLAIKELLYNGPDAHSKREVLDFPNFGQAEAEEAASVALRGHQRQRGDQRLGFHDAPLTPGHDGSSGPPPPPHMPELLLDARANARRASAMSTPTYNHDPQVVSARNRTNALRTSRLATEASRRRAPR